MEIRTEIPLCGRLFIEKSRYIYVVEKILKKQSEHVFD
jgi:hypothetical protein